jgi:hypothetical protein
MTANSHRTQAHHGPLVRRSNLPIAAATSGSITLLDDDRRHDHHFFAATSIVLHLSMEAWI